MTGPDLEIDLMRDQLGRMRGMLYGYSDLFFRRIRDWALVSIGLLVLGSTEVAPGAVVFVPFIVPFAFLETAYLFSYTVFARRFAERLERRIDQRIGADVLIAHRLEAAYFYPPDAPKIAALSAGNPTGLMSVTTVGYTAAAGFLWVAGFAGLLDRAATADVPGYLPAVAALWTASIAAYLVWAFATRHDEDRLLRELDRWDESKRPS